MSKAVRIALEECSEIAQRQDTLQYQLQQCLTRVHNGISILGLFCNLIGATNILVAEPNPEYATDRLRLWVHVGPKKKWVQ